MCVRRCVFGFSREPLELGEDLFDRIEIGRVRRQEKELGADGAYGGAYAEALVAAPALNDRTARSAI